MDELFWDEAGGGYFSNPEGDASILLRMKVWWGGARRCWGGALCVVCVAGLWWGSA